MVTAGSLPSGLHGLTLDPNTGILSGWPATPGTWSFTITATDAKGCTGVQAYTLTIAVAAGIPTLSGWGLMTLMVLIGLVGLASIYGLRRI